MKEEDIKHLEWAYCKLLDRYSAEWFSMQDFKSIIDSLKPKNEFKLIETRHTGHAFETLIYAHLNRTVVTNDMMRACQTPYKRFTVIDARKVNNSTVIFTIRPEAIPAMKETKYKLVIPDEISKDYIKSAHDLSLMDGNIVKPTRESNTTYSLLGVAFPESWLVEIKEESRPCTAEKLLKERRDTGKSCECERCYHEGFRDGFEKSAENESLKHRETESFDEWKSKYMRNIVYTKELIAAAAWMAALKSRGYE